MSNKRIDLTQFEEIEARIKQCQKGFYPAEDLLQELAHHAPSLLAELKRCYEEIDYLNALTNNLPIEMLVEADKKSQASKWGNLDE